VVTWGVAHEEVKSLLPMSLDMLQAHLESCTPGKDRAKWYK
jgi:hypothetical protein